MGDALHFLLGVMRSALTNDWAYPESSMALMGQFPTHAFMTGKLQMMLPPLDM